MNLEDLADLLARGLADIRAAKATAAVDEHAERRLQRRLRQAVGPALAAIEAAIGAGGVPTDDVGRRSLLMDLEALDLGPLLGDELEAAAAAGVDKVEAAVGNAHKALAITTASMFLTDAVDQVRGRMLSRLVSRTIDALAGAVDTPDPTGAVREAFASLLDNELQKMSATALRDAHESAVVETEKELGVEWHQWLTAGDDDVRDDHAVVHGEITRVGFVFSNGWRYPGLIGCRCNVVPWFPPEGMRPPLGVSQFTESDLEPIGPREE